MLEEAATAVAVTDSGGAPGLLKTSNYAEALADGDIFHSLHVQISQRTPPAAPPSIFKNHTTMATPHPSQLLSTAWYGYV